MNERLKLATERLEKAGKEFMDALNKFHIAKVLESHGDKNK